MATKKKTKKITTGCLVPDCPLAVKSRQLCSSHYKLAKRMVENGEADEQDLIDRGLLAPRKIRRRNAAKSLFAKGSKRKGLGARRTSRRGGGR